MQKNSYLYGGKEYQDEVLGGTVLGLYDFEARFADNRIPRFTSIDPLTEKYYNISPYAYCLNNPLRYVDRDGRAPGDLFKTKDAAAKSWGNYYNGASILRGKEFGSTIYSVEKSGRSYYTYSAAEVGSNDRVKPSSPPNGEPVEAIIHSHGEYDGVTPIMTLLLKISRIAIKEKLIAIYQRRTVL